MTVSATLEPATVPKGWIRINLGNQEFFDLIMGQSPSSETYTTKKTGLPFLQGNADFGVIHPNPKTYCNEPMKVAEKDDVLISVRAPVGELNIATERYCIGRGLGAIRPKNKHDSKFLYFYLNHYRHDLERLSAGSTFKAITKDDLEKFSVTFPPLGEKQKIVSILTTVDDAIQRSRQAAAETELLKAGVMQELMTKGIGHTEFKEDPDVGKVPKEWNIAPLLKNFDIFSGHYFELSDFCDAGIKCLKIDNVDYGKINWNLTTYLPKKFAEGYLDLVLKPEDIVIALNRPITNDQLKIGILTTNDAPSILYQRVGKFVFKNTELDKKFIFFLFNSDYFKRSIKKSLIGTDQPYIRTPVLLKIPIPIPSFAEQHHIAIILSTIDRKLSLQRQRTAHYEQLKQGLMNELLTGKRRVQVT